MNKTVLQKTMKPLRIIFCLILMCGGSLTAIEREIEFAEKPPEFDGKARQAALTYLLEKLYDKQVSADAAWEVFSAFFDQGESLRDKVLAFVNILSNGQALLPKGSGHLIRPNGPFMRDCANVLSIKRETLLKHFATIMADDGHPEETVLFDAKKLFRSFGTEELERLIEKNLETAPSNTTATTEQPKTEEQPGSAQSVPKPEDKPPVKDQPSRPTLKDAPR